MKDPDLIRLNKTVTGLTAMVHGLMYENLAIQRILKDLLPTMTTEQQQIICRYSHYKKEMAQDSLIRMENTNPRLAAVISSFLAGEKVL